MLPRNFQVISESPDFSILPSIKIKFLACSSFASSYCHQLSYVYFLGHLAKLQDSFSVNPLRTAASAISWKYMAEAYSEPCKHLRWKLFGKIVVSQGFEYTFAWLPLNLYAANLADEGSRHHVVFDARFWYWANSPLLHKENKT